MTADAGPRQSLDLGIVGNCAFAALIDRMGSVVWSCMPDVDGDPVFYSLLDDGGAEGRFAIDLVDGVARVEQSYRRNTPILETRLYDERGNCVKITDFAPRFTHYGRRFRPLILVRMLEPVAGTPRIRVRLRPSFDYGGTAPHVTHGSNHIRFAASPLTLRLTTDAPIPYILEERPFLLQRPVTLHLGPDETLDGPPDAVAQRFLERTVEYWRVWVRSLVIPFEWQDAVIRSAITLKLCAYEPTGAIVAALTTSIPEAPGSGRNWDYRYCWLRDAFFVLQALNRAAVHQTMEDFLAYLDNIVAGAPDGRLQPVYGITQESRLDEWQCRHMKGYRGMAPVRVGNAAYGQAQHDVYGDVIVAAAPAFFDKRLLRPFGTDAFHRLEPLGESAFALHATPDAGMWELRSRSRVHTSSAMMCWAACDRLARIAHHLGLDDRALYWAKRAEHIHRVICERAWNASLNSFVASFEGADLDANLLLIEELGCVDARDPRFAATVAAVERTLKRGPYVFRYAIPDDFGTPKTAFTVCSFWYINAIAALGRREEARDLLDQMLSRCNPLGHLSEDIDPDTHELWGTSPRPTRTSA